ncbi:C-reactive protein 1.4-like [Centruroides sculpturatus]|uniref:C-reactive protein 1.4-like n=1 Tax=Centruroides sculpturatus TaxID=218467 RepID=UPI000C6E9312|nr:C-reactive protein 1.4-like [Centruroides sculpturatus]
MSSCLVLIPIILIGYCLGGVTKFYFLPSNNSNYPRLVSRDKLPTLNALTLCSWIRLHSSKNMTLISYSTSDTNGFHISLQNGRIKLIIANETMNSMCYFPKIGTWSYLCVVWFGPTGFVNIYLNHEKCEHSYHTFLTAGEIIRGGKKFIIGQYRETPDSNFHSNHSWEGEIANFRVWNEVLSYEQTVETGKCNGKYRDGNVISMMKTPMMAFDGVIFSETKLCELK